MSSIDAGGHRIHVTSDGEGPPRFLCLHGLVDTHAIWDALAPDLAQRGAVARIDQRGHGDSDSPPGPYSRSDLADDAVAVLDALSAERAVLVGHSMGGIVSMQTALDHPGRVAGLILIGTASQCSEKVAGWYERIARAGETDGCEGIGRAIYGKKPRPVQGDALGIAHVTRMLKTLHGDPLTPRLAEIRCPVLALVGEKDPMGVRASEIVAERAPDATLHSVPGGHWVHVDAPRAIIDAYDRWEIPR